MDTIIHGGAISVLSTPPGGAISVLSAPKGGAISVLSTLKGGVDKASLFWTEIWIISLQSGLEPKILKVVPISIWNTENGKKVFLSHFGQLPKF